MRFILDTDSIFDYRKLTILENFSRTVRNYVPSSIPIPAAAPAAPYVSCTITADSFMPSAPLYTTTARTKAQGISNRSAVGLTND
jgi:hypothetical protein